MQTIFLTLEKLAFYFLLFTLPFNIRKIIFSWGKYFNEYQAAFVYATDILIIAILSLWLLRYLVSKFSIFNFQFPNKFQISNFKSQNSTFYFLLSTFLIWCFVSLFWADNSELGFYKWLRLFLFSLFFLYIKNDLKNYEFKKIALLIAGAGIVQSIIAIAQFAGQKSIGLSLLGESTFGWGISGTATFRLLGAKIIRTSGTFPHANLLAAFLLVSLFFLFYLYLKRNEPKIGIFTSLKAARNSHCEVAKGNRGNLCLYFMRLLRGVYPEEIPKQIRNDTFGARNDKITKRSTNYYALSLFKYLFREIYFAVSLYIIILAIILTFSRSALLLALLFIPLMFLWLFLNKPLREKYLLNAAKLLVILTFIGSFLFLIFFNFIFARANISLSEPAINDRLVYNQMAWDLIKENPLRGIGLGNYIWLLNKNNLWHQYGLLYPYLFQPVHNIYLLIASEIGLVGLILFLLFLFFALKHSFYSNKNILLSTFYFLLSICLFWGFSDHFLWTLNQGQLMWWLVLGILSARQCAQI